MRNAHRRGITALASASIIVVMIGLTAASVPLYRLFCQATGYGGTTQRAEKAPPSGGEASGPPITISFNADVSPDLPWAFRPMQHSVAVRPGEEKLIFYEAVNHSDKPVVGQATFNVTPFEAGSYFDKIQCFCFNEQTLQPGERVEMGVSFFIDPEILKDPNARDLRQVTLSYTFYIDRQATAELQRRSAGHIG